jgi:hypothetical protein
MRIRGQVAMLMVILAAIVLAGIIALFYFVEIQVEATQGECTTDDDCVPSTCCHADSCVPKGEAPSCDDTFCTAVCEPGTLDCNQGSCKCINNKCGAVFNE